MRISNTNNNIYNNIYNTLRTFGMSSTTSDSIASLSSIDNFYKKNIHIAYAIINNKEIWCMNRKKIEIPHSRKCSEHAEERLVKKINKCFYRKKNKSNKISIYSLRINNKGHVKCAKPCRDCMNYILNSRVKIKNILWYEYVNGNIQVVSAKPCKHVYETCGISSGRKYHQN